jgi:precorrin-6B methylase 2
MTEDVKLLNECIAAIAIERDQARAALERAGRERDRYRDALVRIGDAPHVKACQAATVARQALAVDQA